MVQVHDFSTYSRFTNFAFFSPCVMFGRGGGGCRASSLGSSSSCKFHQMHAINIRYNDKNKVNYKIYHYILINVIIPQRCLSVHLSHKWVLFQCVAVYLVRVRADEGNARPVHQYVAVECQSQPEVLKGQMRMRQVGNDALCKGQEWMQQSQWMGKRVSRGVQEGSNFDQY